MALADIIAMFANVGGRRRSLATGEWRIWLRCVLCCYRVLLRRSPLTPRIALRRTHTYTVLSLVPILRSSHDISHLPSSQSWRQPRICTMTTSMMLSSSVAILEDSEHLAGTVLYSQLSSSLSSQPSGTWKSELYCLDKSMLVQSH